ncbi:MAG TPA: glycosyltransferase family 4 protein [Pyrinomonadaceae bacterium]|nr:glycosyltransferase family 4 protein [Pyrinomonadaceae bacterium]
MRVLLLNQCFYPDVVSTAQHLTELALGLVEQGHQVTVITSDRGYDNPENRFPPREVWRGISIIRIPSISIGKKSKWRRALNFGSFLVNCTLRLLLMSRFDVVVSLTSPPLISFLGSLFVNLKGGKLVFWVMDLNPDEAIAAGWLKEKSLAARLLTSFLTYSLRHAEKIVVLDRFMRARILKKGIAEQKLVTIAPWSHSDAVRFDADGREAFRKEHGFSDKFVVMYSGNHSPCHPLDTLVQAAGKLGANSEVSFAFVGGGSEQTKVRDYAARQNLTNVICLPYQPLEKLAGSLSAADLHVVVMGEPFVGIVHPCKVYNILEVGAPILYIGPGDSHVVDLMVRTEAGANFWSARHGEIERVAKHIKECEQAGDEARSANELAAGFSREALLPQMLKLLESVGAGALKSSAAIPEAEKQPATH